MHAYATPWEIWQELDAETSGANAPPDWLIRLCEAAAQRIDRFCRRRFRAERGARLVNRGPDPLRLWLPDDLVAIERVAVGRDAPAEWTEGVDYRAGPLNRLPRKWLYAIGGRSFAEAAEAVAAVEVTGTWGYPEDGEEAVGALGAPLAADATAIPLAGGARWAGAVLALGEERLYCTAADDAGLTVRRGEHGTAAAAHDAGAELTRALAQPAIRSAATALAARAHRQVKAAYTDVSGMATLGITATAVQYVKSLPADVRLDLESFRRTR